LRLPYVVLDRLRKLKPAPRAVAEEIYRAAAGWHSDECVISLGKLAHYCNIDEKNVRIHLRTLEVEGYIRRLRDEVGGRDLDSRGIRFRILLPRMTPARKVTPDEKGGGPKSSPNKEKNLKELSKGEGLAPKNCPDCNGTGHFFENPADPSTWKLCKHERL
jgi:hypothetical protein